MAGRKQHSTGIEWTHFPDGYLGVERWRGMTWNPSVGCSRVSPGCDNCYAFSLHDRRYADNLWVAREVIREGAHVDLSGETAIREPLGQILAVRRVEPKRLPWPPQYDLPFSRVQLLPDRLDQPLHWRKPRAVFVDSMADLFHEDVPDDYLDRTFAAMALAPQHIFMILTKRPERARDYIGSGRLVHVWSRMLDADEALRASDVDDLAWPLPNVWLGTSVEGQDQIDRLTWLRATPAALRFVSIEPLLSPVDLTQHLRCNCPADEEWQPPEMHDPQCPFRARINWVLVGGESGRGWRPMSDQWVEDIQRQCREAGVAYFGKQRADYRSGQPLPGDLNRHEWPDGYYLGQYHEGSPA